MVTFETGSQELLDVADTQQASSSSRSLGDEDRNCEVASIWVHKALEGSTKWVDTCSEEQMRVFRLWRASKLAAGPVKYSYLALGLLEIPSWCLHNRAHCAEHHHHDMLTLAVPLIVSDTLEILFLAFFLLRWWLRRRALGSAYCPGGWKRFGFCCIILSLLDCLVACFDTVGIIPTSFRVSRLCRPFIVLSSTRTLRRVARRIAASLPHLVDALASLVMCLALFVWVGMLLFARTPEGRQKFSSWSQGLTSLWVLYTTANFPDVMMPGFNHTRLTFVFFFLFLVVTLYVLNNVILASVYDAYKEQLTHDLREFYTRRECAIRHAFGLLADSSGEVHIPRWERFFKYHFGCTYGQMSVYDSVRSKTIFRVMDYDHSNGLSYRQFHIIISAILDKKIYIPSTLPPQMANGPWGQAARTLVFSGMEIFGLRVFWDGAVDVIVAVEILLIFLQTIVFVSPEDGGPFNPTPLQQDSIWFFILFCFTCVYFVETSLRLTVLGWERYCHKRPFQYRCDLITTYPLFVIEVLLLTRVLPDRFCCTVPLLRMARGVRLLRHMKRLDFLGKVLLRLVPVYKHLGLMLFLIYLTYATVGVQCFGGLIHKENPALAGSDYAAGGYWLLNFNDTMSGMITLFVLMVVNNWFVIADAFIRVTDTKWAVAFFVSFFLIVNLVVLNILVALILECFSGVSKEIIKPAVIEEEAESQSHSSDFRQVRRSLTTSQSSRSVREALPVNSEEALLRQLLLAEPEGAQAMSILEPSGVAVESLPSLLM